MLLGVAGTLRREFAGRSEAAAFQHFQHQQEEARKRRERKDDLNDDASDLIDMATLLVSEAEMSEFRIELDRYDAATIEALYANEVALELIMKKKEELLGRAFVLPDGRRVFKSEDGIRIFDEDGAELDHSEIDPALIGPEHPSWEAYKPILDESIRLEEERRALLEFQQKLDAARERLDAGDLTQDEFDSLRNDLKADMPEAVRSQIPDPADEQPQPGAIAPATTQEEGLVIDDDMVPASSAPKALIPG